MNRYVAKKQSAGGFGVRENGAARVLIADKGYGSDALRERLSARGIERIAPNRSNRKRRTAAGHSLRRCRRRWKVERTFAWLGNFRRLTVRWDRLFVIYRAFFHVACLLIAARHLRSYL